MFRLGCPLLDHPLRGGLLVGSVIEIVGESASGKTQISLQILLSALLPLPAVASLPPPSSSTLSSLFLFDTFELSSSSSLSDPLDERTGSISLLSLSIDLNGDDFKALVFEFMPNKSLDRWLHPNLEEDQHQHARSLSLTQMTQRLNIGIDVAEALDYLHHNCKPPVVHCDLKPSNILLDEEMMAHVGDFGLAKLLPEGMSRCLADKSNSLGLRGTIGYVPPEYGEGSPVSTSGDVYSFGVPLMELLGKSPLGDMFKGGLTLPTLVETRGASEIVDPASLRHENGMNSSNSFEEYSISLARISLACTKRMPGDRMHMSDVVAQLRGIGTLFV